MNVRLLLTAFLLLFLVACATSAQTGSQNSASARTERGANSCRGADLLAEIDAAYAANQFRAEAEYGDKRVCVTGNIAEFWKTSNRHGRFLVTRAEVVPGASFVIEGNLNADASEEKWESWLMSMSTGDLIEADCLYDPGRPEIWYSDRQEEGPVSLAFHDCELRK